MEDNSPVEQPHYQKRTKKARDAKSTLPKVKEETKKVMQIGSTSIIPLKGTEGAERLLLDENLSDRDEAEASGNFCGFCRPENPLFRGPSILVNLIAFFSFFR